MSEYGIALIVEDDPEQLAVHEMHVAAQGYTVETAEDGKSALAKLEAEPERYSVILSDIVMPGMDGYEFCMAVKENPELNTIPLVFISQLSTLDEVIKGYSVGADDYIPKPMAPEVLSFKLNNLQEIRTRNKALAERVNESQQVAMQAMAYSSDLGQVVEFYKNTMAASSFEELAKMLFEATSAQGLQCSLQIILPDKQLNFSDQGEMSPMEANVIELSRPKARFFDFGCRTVINYKDFSLLTKNMPIEDPERYGITKDTLGSLCNAIEARLQFLLYENKNEQKNLIVGTVMGAMEKIDDSFGKIQQANQQVINNMMDELDEQMMDLGLTSSQENMVRAIVERCRDDSKRVFEQGSVLYDQFEHVRESLDSILSGK